MVGRDQKTTKRPALIELTADLESSELGARLYMKDIEVKVGKLRPGYQKLNSGTCIKPW